MKTLFLLLFTANITFSQVHVYIQNCNKEGGNTEFAQATLLISSLKDEVRKNPDLTLSANAVFSNNSIRVNILVLQPVDNLFVVNAVFLKPISENFYRYLSSSVSSASNRDDCAKLIYEYLVNAISENGIDLPPLPSPTSFEQIK